MMKYKKFIINLFLFVIFLNQVNLSNWFVEKEFLNSAVYYLSINDTGVVWGVGNDDPNTWKPFVTVRTPASGWKVLPVTGLPNGFLACVSIAGIDSMNAFVGTRTGKIFRTTNGGLTWNLHIDAGGGYINDIAFSKTDPSYGYIVCDPPSEPGTPFKIYKTSNYGVTWIEFNTSFGPNTVGYDRSISVTDSDHVWFGLFCNSTNCLESKIGYTTNGGNTWNTLTVPDPHGFGVTDIEFRTDNNYGLASCYTGGFNTFIFSTTNSGLNWNSLYTMPVSDEVHNLCWISNSSDWYYCVTSEIRKSNNNGTSWSLSALLSGTEQYTHMDAINAGNKNYAWACLNNGKIMKLVDISTTIGIEPVNNLIPKSFSLRQNYPNPFNPVTTIRFDAASEGYVNLVVYDFLDREVAVLVNDHLHAGEYAVNFNASNLSGGVYLYKLSIRGERNFTSVKKLVLVK